MRESAVCEQLCTFQPHFQRGTSTLERWSTWDPAARRSLTRQNSSSIPGGRPLLPTLSRTSRERKTHPEWFKTGLCVCWHSWANVSLHKCCCHYIAGMKSQRQLLRQLAAAVHVAQLVWPQFSVFSDNPQWRTCWTCHSWISISIPSHQSTAYTSTESKFTLHFTERMIWNQKYFVYLEGNSTVHIYVHVHIYCTYINQYT